MESVTRVDVDFLRILDDIKTTKIKTDANNTFLLGHCFGGAQVMYASMRGMSFVIQCFVHRTVLIITIYNLLCECGCGCGCPPSKGGSVRGRGAFGSPAIMKGGPQAQAVMCFLEMEMPT